ncbi:MAG: cyanophycin synthetase family protein [Gemmatimonadaceae bacterium]
MTTLHSARGANYWSRRPVTRMDLEVGAYDDVSSAQVPGFTDALLAAMPGLEEHRCSIGERGGFVLRLRRGTYAPHIIEHVALELQTMIGHDVGYGRTRGGDVPGEYTLVFEHLHEAVGLRAAALALETVQRAFAGTLTTVEHAVAELASLAATPDVPALGQRVLCGITGGAFRGETRDEITRLGCRTTANGEAELIVDVAPSYIFYQGLPYAHSELAIVLDARPTDVPERYRDPERARRLVGVVADAVREGGVVIAPAKEWEVQDMARDAGCRVAVFATDDDLTARDKKVARAAALVDGGRIVLECRGRTEDGGALRDDAPAAAQVAAALALFTMRELGLGPGAPVSALPAADAVAGA